MDAEKLSQIALNCLMMVMTSGASYKEGTAVFSALAALMKQIDITPNADDNALVALATSILATELKQDKTSQA